MFEKLLLEPGSTELLTATFQLIFDLINELDKLKKSHLLIFVKIRILDLVGL